MDLTKNFSLNLSNSALYREYDGEKITVLINSSAIEKNITNLNIADGKYFKRM